LSNENSDIGKHWQHLRYSFIREEHVHPLIVKELLGWLSDRYATVVSVDLTSANRSNRFSGEFSVRQFNGDSWVHYEGEDGDYFKYRHLGASSSGIHIVHGVEGGGGTGVFHSLMLLVLQSDTGIISDGDRMEVREHVLLKTLGSISLGDRYSGELLFADGKLRIGRDESLKKYGGLLKDILLEIK
jgi:protein tyrosine phosphatase